jgi:putative two-component system response regulator
LKGEEIPIAARLFAIIDVWDAITSDRPYRKAMSRQEAYQLILRESGRHFDPAVVQLFMSCVDEM